MQLKTLYLPLLAFLFTLSFVDLPPVAALFLPARLGGLSHTVVAFFQQHAFPEIPLFRTNEVDLELEHFWQRARELGETARQYGEKLIEETAERSKDVREKIGELKERMDEIVHGAKALRDEFQASVKRRTQRSSDESENNDFSTKDMAGDLERAFEKVLDELKVMFPAPDQAPGHEERQKVVTVALEKAGGALIAVCVKHGMDEKRVGGVWGTVQPAIEKMVVSLGMCCGIKAEWSNIAVKATLSNSTPSYSKPFSSHFR
jgi:DNA-binding ferritin-like protein